MTLTLRREPVLRRSAARSTLLLLSLVIAIIAGLLAMHTLTSSMGSHDVRASGPMVMTVGTDHFADATTPPRPKSVIVECSGACDPGLTMAVMECILALLAAPIALVAARSENRSMFAARPAQHYRGFVAVNPRESGVPPDLIALSISRT